MRKEALCSPLADATSSAKLSGLSSLRNHARATRSTGYRRSSKSFRLSCALSKGVGIVVVEKWLELRNLQGSSAGKRQSMLPPHYARRCVACVGAVGAALG